MSKIFREGGPLNIRNAGGDTYEMSVPIPKGEDGRIARECIDANCSPAYFKVLPETGITGNHETAYCPYCRASAPPQNFVTEDQLRYAKDVLAREAVGGVERMLKSALGLGAGGKRTISGGLLSIEMSLKTNPRPHVQRPFEEEVRRDLVCPRCGLHHSVYGLAVWCPDCGEDIFMTHVSAEADVVRAMLSDVSRRRELFGKRVAAKDIENCLEDTVSIMEAALRALTRRALAQQGKTGEEVDAFFKKIGNGFQNLERTQAILLDHFHLNVADALSAQALEGLTSTFEKRHPITHNLGIIDKKYLRRTTAAEEEGKEVLVSEAEVHGALESLLLLSTYIHSRLFPSL